MSGPTSLRPVATTAVALLIATASLAQAQADREPFAMLLEPGRAWTFELVTGRSLDALAPVPGAPPTRCQVADTRKLGARSLVRIDCAPVGDPGPDAAPALTRRLHLVVDRTGVREVVADSDDSAQLAAERLTGAFTFPRRLGRHWKQDFARPDGAHSHVEVRREVTALRGARTELWIAEATHRGPAAGAPEPEPVRSAAAFAPGLGPALMCSVASAAGPTAYTCLRLTNAPGAGAPATRPQPAPQIRVAKKKAHEKSSLSAAAVATKVTGSYASAIRRCYADALRKKPAMRGTLVLDFTVNAVGKLSEPAVKAPDEALATCVRGAMASWRFPIPQSEYSEPRNVRFTLELRLTPE